MVGKRNPMLVPDENWVYQFSEKVVFPWCHMLGSIATYVKSMALILKRVRDSSGFIMSDYGPETQIWITTKFMFQSESSFMKDLQFYRLKNGIKYKFTIH